MLNEKACFLYKIEKTFVLNLDLSTNTLFRFHFADEHCLQQKYDTDVYIIHTDEISIVLRLYQLIILNKFLITQLLINNTAQQNIRK